MHEQHYAPVAETLGATTTGDLGTHTFLAPCPALNERFVTIEDIEKKCNVICGPKVCSGRCGRPTEDLWSEAVHVREGLTQDEPDQFQPHSMTEFDICHGNSLTGLIQLMLRAAICLSVASCIGRSDFSLPVLLYSYYEWSICGEWHRDVKIYKVRDNIPVSHLYERTSSLLVATPSTIRGVGLSACLLSAAVVIDTIWLLSATAAWTCAFAPDDDCLSGGLQQTRRLHALVLSSALANLILMAIITAASWTWLRIQRRSTQYLEAAAL